MKISLTGSLGNIGKPLTQQLIAAGHQVTVISNSTERQKEIESLGATAAVGSVSDEAFLTAAFAGADAVFAMTPPNLGGVHVIRNTIEAGKALAGAISASGVRRVVMLSSIGADLPEGNGPIRAIHHIEEGYNQLPGIALTCLRAGYFYTNYYSNIPLIRNAGIIGSNYPASTLLPLVHPRDIATAAAEELQRNGGKIIRYVVSDVRPAGDLAAVLGQAIGKPDLPWVEFSDEQSLQGMTGAGVPEEIAGLYTEMGSGFRSGKIPADFIREGSPVSGLTKLEDFAGEFALRYL